MTKSNGTGSWSTRCDYTHLYYHPVTKFQKRRAGETETQHTHGAEEPGHDLHVFVPTYAACSLLLLTAAEGKGRERVWENKRLS